MTMQVLTVNSRAADRPSNARSEWGVAWLRWDEKGDADGNTDDGVLLLRNMMSAPDFKQALQNTKTVGDEKAVLVPYLADIAYRSKADLEAQGCPVRRQ